MTEMSGAWQYWNHEAHTKPEACALATRLGLEIPQGRAYAMTYPMRRLIVTGEDTPENKAILFGPT